MTDFIEVMDVNPTTGGNTRMTETPFAEGTDYQTYWDSTSLGTLKECPRKYYYMMILGLRPKGTSMHLTFGAWLTEALEHYYKHRAKNLVHDEAMAEVALEALQKSYGWVTDDSYKNRYTLIRSIIWYLEQYRNDKAETLILQDGTPAVELSFKFQLNSDISLCGHLDRVVTFQGETYIQDHKTTKSMPGPLYYAQYNPDTQMSLYSIAGQVILGSPVRGVMLDVIQVAVGFTRFDRGFTYRTPGQNEEWIADLRHWVEDSWRMADKKYYPMNDKSCNKFLGCQYREVCSRDASVRDIFLKADYEYNPWNPVIPR